MGLLEDILGFAKEGLQQAGQTAAGQTQKSGDILKAIQAGKPIPKGQSGSLLQSVLGIAPMGMISPAAWKGLEPEAKAALTTFLDKYGLSDVGGPESFFNRPFRAVGKLRKTGQLQPEDYQSIISKIPGYDKFIGKTRSLVERVLGPEFSGFRGQAASDPLFQLPLTQGQLPSATAVSLRPEVAKNFAEWAAGKEPAYAAKMSLTPESVEGLLPTRATPHSHEAELLVNPQKARDISLQGSVMSPTGLSVSSNPQWGAPNQLLQSILNEVLQRGGAQ